MADVTSLSGVQALLYPPDAPLLRRPEDALDLIGDALGQRADWVVIPADRLDPGFFQLRTGFAGELLQKFVNYHLRVVVVGDISEFVAHSTALRDFVAESNRGRTVWFLNDLAELERRLTPPWAG